MTNPSTTTYTIEVFYDGDCPLCRREIEMLMRRQKPGAIRFTDIAAPTFSPSAIGVSHEELMAQIHGRLADGSLVTGVEVFRHLYSAIGLGWLAALTRLPGISHLLEFAYAKFAKHRLRLTGRCSDRCTSIPAELRSPQ